MRFIEYCICCFLYAIYYAAIMPLYIAGILTIVIMSGVMCLIIVCCFIWFYEMTSDLIYFLF